MPLAITIGSEAIGVPASPPNVIIQAVEAEREGFSAAWCTAFSRGIDALTTLAGAAAATSRIELGVGVVPSYPRHPVTLAQAALTIGSIAHGRFTLGVGVSHQGVIEGMYGLDYSDPLGHLREYLTVLTDVLTTGESDFQGDHFRVAASVAVPDHRPVPVMVGGLSKRMSRLAGELTAGVVTWLAGPRSLEMVVVPAVLEGAASRGRPAPRVTAAVPVAVDSDLDRAHETAAQVFARYGTLPNYQRLFDREGVEGPADLALVGDEESVIRQLRALLGAGATDIWAVPFPTGGDPRATTALLKEFDA